MRIFYSLLFAVITLATPALAQTVTPTAGEGIWSVLRRSGITPTPESVAEFKSLNADALRGGSTLHAGRAYRLPESEDVQTEPLFGPSYERVDRISDVLEDHVYYLVSGHGGPDPGAIGRYNGTRIYEDEIAYDTMLRTARELMRHGATVEIIIQDPDDGIRDVEILSGDTDERHADGTLIPANPVKKLRQRTELINTLARKHARTAKVQRVLSLHVDATGLKNEPQIDVHFVHATPAGYRIGRTLSNTIKANYDEHQPGRGYRQRIERRNLYILQNTIPPAVLVELGNIRHRGDQYRLMKPANRQALAEWLTQGVLAEAGAVKS
ncbi:MAG: N-acetylmuramoyl-L-alanine amidase [Rhodothermales bacterium]